MVTNLAAQIASAAVTATVVAVLVCVAVVIVRAATGPRRPPGDRR